MPLRATRALVVTLAIGVAGSCAFDWDLFDPRLAVEPDASGGNGGATAGPGGIGGAGASSGGSGGSGGAGGIEPTTARFRSVGPGNTRPLASGGANPLVIAGVTASFSRTLPDRVGVGDVVQYDADGDGELDALAFIHARMSASAYEVRDAGGEAPASVSGDTGWSIHRAYTSLADAVNGQESTGIAAPLRDFDRWTGGKDLLTDNEIWHIACYSDAVDDKPVVIDGWSTSAVNRLRIFTPTDPGMVGVSQRHQGVAGSGYVMNTSTAPPPLTHVITLVSHYVDIEGLEITGWLNDVLENSREAVHVVASGTLLSALLIHGDQHPDTTNPNGDAINLESMLDGWTLTVRNSVIYDISRSAINFQGSGAPVVHIESCTVANTGTSGGQADGQAGIAFGGNPAAVVTVTNTISVGVGADDLDFSKTGDNWGSSSHNVSSDATAPGPGSLIGVFGADLFVSPADFHLAGGAPTIDAAIDLPGFDLDIDGDLRPSGAWDIGADERVP